MREEGRHPPGPERPAREDDATLVLRALCGRDLVLLHEAREGVVDLARTLAHEHIELGVGRGRIGCRGPFRGRFEDGALLRGEWRSARVVPPVNEDNTGVLGRSEGYELCEDPCEVRSGQQGLWAPRAREHTVTTYRCARRTREAGLGWCSPSFPQVGQSPERWGE